MYLLTTLHSMPEVLSINRWRVTLICPLKLLQHDNLQPHTSKLAHLCCCLQFSRVSICKLSEPSEPTAGSSGFRHAGETPALIAKPVGTVTCEQHICCRHCRCCQCHAGIDQHPQQMLLRGTILAKFVARAYVASRSCAFGVPQIVMSETICTAERLVVTPFFDAESFAGQPWVHISGSSCRLTAVSGAVTTDSNCSTVCIKSSSRCSRSKSNGEPSMTRLLAWGTTSNENQ